ncbi:hypothetical protein [Chitinophaga sp. Cy-1792]|uniref:hypothetical protein n=1 Tax=Chitinophaga sp. Cy-1792 TaxID=2608339 RepID=UPI00141DC8DC|nr:hypothetical protein [Chitinophaga sp. Cy-1792]NIG56564.1 hypothetical protein [Chitinophaga sp. Cy-1792]
MEDNLASILNESRRTISKLQLLSAFFEDEIIYKIYLRSQVVHKLFENNVELDINKLELFHLQYTASVIELLRKIKSTNERNISLLFDEIQINNDLIEKLNTSVFSEKNFDLDKQKQSLKINLSLRKLFQSLSDDTNEDPFSKNINAFASRFAQDFYYDITPEMMDTLVQYDPAKTYRNNYAIIEKKLMGWLCKTEFRTEFFIGLRAGYLIAEIYKFLENDKFFLYLPSKNLFLFCDPASIKDIDLTNHLSKKARIIADLTDKNYQLNQKASVEKIAIPQKVKEVLREYAAKIEEVDFLQKIGNYDVQTNILKTMLNTDIL